MTKDEMLKRIKEEGWMCDVDKNSRYADVKEEYETIVKEIEDDSDLFPNGRDHDAEDEE